MNDSAKPADAELLEQLADAVYRRECSATYACQQSYKLGLAQGRLEGAQLAAAKVTTICENVKVAS